MKTKKDYYMYFIIVFMLAMSGAGLNSFIKNVKENNELKKREKSFTQFIFDEADKISEAYANEEKAKTMDMQKPQSIERYVKSLNKNIETYEDYIEKNADIIHVLDEKAGKKLKFKAAIDTLNKGKTSDEKKFRDVFKGYIDFNKRLEVVKNWNEKTDVDIKK